MAIIQIFDPALCCSSGVCGIEVEQRLLQFSADADWARQNGAQLQRYNLAMQPMAFAENAAVRRFLELSGADALPLTLVDGSIALAGRYPNRAELVRWAGIASGGAAAAAPCCGAGTPCHG